MLPRKTRKTKEYTLVLDLVAWLMRRVPAHSAQDETLVHCSTDELQNCATKVGSP